MTQVVTISERAHRFLRRFARIHGKNLQQAATDLLPLVLEHGQRRDPVGPVTQVELDGSSPHLTAAELSGRFEDFCMRLLRKVRGSHAPPRIAMEFFELPGPAMGVRLPNGRAFVASNTVSKRARLVFPLVQDAFPDHYTLRQFDLVSEVQQRYLRYIERPDRWHFPKDAEVMVEAGGYIGWKAIAMADHMGDVGKVLAIEMESENYKVMRDHIALNGLSERVVPVNVAVGDSIDSTQFYRLGPGTTANSLVQIDRRGEVEKSSGTVPVTTLEALLDEHGIQNVDYLTSS